LHHGSSGGIQIALDDLIAFMGGGNQASAKGFSEDEQVPRVCAPFGEDAFWMDHAGYRETVFRLFIANRMSTGDDANCLSNDIGPTASNLAEYSVVEIIGPSYEVDSHQDLTPHSIDVAGGVGGGDGSEDIRIIDNRWEEVSSADDGLLLVDAVDSGIVSHMDAYQQFRWNVGDGEWTQNLRQGRWAHF